MQTEQQQIWDVLLKLDQALLQKNARIFDELLSPDFIGSVPTGAAFDREAYIRHHCENPFGVIQLAEEDREEASIRVYADTAVVNRRVHAHFKLPSGEIMEYDVQRMEVLLKTDNRWKLASGQGTRVMALQPAR